MTGKEQIFTNGPTPVVTRRAAQWAERARDWIEAAGELQITEPYPMNDWLDMVARREALLEEWPEVFTKPSREQDA